MLIHAAATLDRLVTLTAPGAEVAPVVTGLDSVSASLAAGRPSLARAPGSVVLLGELDRVRGAAATLRNSLAELAANDGMVRFDPAFTADDASWDAWFTSSAELVRQAAALVGQAPTTSMRSV